jgi:hypothetical protein
VPIEIEFTDEFGVWWEQLLQDEQTKVAVGIELLSNC